MEEVEELGEGGGGGGARGRYTASRYNLLTSYKYSAGLTIFLYIMGMYTAHDNVHTYMFTIMALESKLLKRISSWYHFPSHKISYPDISMV